MPHPANPTASGPVAIRRRRRRRGFALLALAIGLLLTLVCTEIAFRLFWRMPTVFADFQQAGLYVQLADGHIGLCPGYRGTLDIGNGVPTKVSVNRLGLRGEEIGPKQAGERRLLVVGDSLVFGYGVENDEALPAQLQRELTAKGKPTTVGNAGVPGFGSREAVAAMSHHDAPFGADAFVVCGYLGNDAVDDLRVDLVAYGGMKFDGPMARLIRSSWRMRLAVHSRAMLWLEAWLFTNYPRWSPLAQQVPSPEELDELRGLPGTYPVFAPTSAGLFLDVADAERKWDASAPPLIPRLMERLRTSLQRAKALAGDRPVLFVILPTRYHVEESMRLRRLQELGFDPQQFPRGTAQRRWLEVAREVGMPAFDATSVLVAAGAAADLFVDDGHLSSRGGWVVAGWLAGEIAALLR